MGRWLYLISLGALGALILRACVVEGVVVPTASMEPTVPVGHHAFVNKLAYRLSPPKRGDIVVFPSPVEKKDLVKRVIAVAGDTIALKDKHVILNDLSLNEPYVQYTRPDEILKGDNMDPRAVPAGHVFVMGDNRDQSGDSRDWTDARTGAYLYFIPVKKIKGRVMGVR